MNITNMSTWEISNTLQRNVHVCPALAKNVKKTTLNNLTDHDIFLILYSVRSYDYKYPEVDHMKSFAVLAESLGKTAIEKLSDYHIYYLLTYVSKWNTNDTISMRRHTLANILSLYIDKNRIQSAYSNHIKIERSYFWNKNVEIPDESNSWF